MTRARKIEGDLQKGWVGSLIGSYRESKRGQSKRVVDAAHEFHAIGCHRQRAAKLPVAEDRVRAGAVRRIAQVELSERVLKGVVLPGAQLRMLRYLGDVLGAKLLDDVGLTGEKSRQRGLEVGCNAPDQSIELRRAAIVGRVCDELNGRARDPANESVLARTNRVFCGVRGAPTGRRNAFPDMLGHDRQLVHRIVELLRRASMKPIDGCQGIRATDRVDVRYYRPYRRSERGILRTGDRESNIARSHRNA